MLLFHVLFSAGEVFHFETAHRVYKEVLVTEPFIAVTFVFLSGICSVLSRSNLKRGFILLAAALCINIVTEIFAPDIAIRFGVINLLSICMILYGLKSRLFSFASRRLSSAGRRTSHTDFFGWVALPPASKLSFRYPHRTANGRRKSHTEFLGWVALPPASKLSFRYPHLTANGGQRSQKILTPAFGIGQHYRLRPNFSREGTRQAANICGAVLCFIIFTLTWGVNFRYIGFFGLYKFVTLPGRLYASPYMFWLGFRSPAFSSGDYFPLLPWLYMFFCGSYFAGIFKGKKLPQTFYKVHSALLSFAGRHSLIIYIVHQPIIFAVLYAVSMLSAVW